MNDSRAIVIEPKSDFKELVESVCSSYQLILSDLTVNETTDPYIQNILTNRENIFGRYLFNESSTKSINDKTNIFNNIYSFVPPDIKQPETSSENLGDVRESYLTIFDNSLFAAYTVDIEFSKILKANDFTVKLFGYNSRLEFLSTGEPSFHYVNLIDYELIIYNLKKYGEIKLTNLKLRKLDGTIFFGNFYGKLNSKKNNIECVLIDTTDLKLIEEKYYNLFHNSLIPIIITDYKTGKIISVNNFGAVFFGYKSERDFIEKFNASNHFLNLSDFENIRQEFIEHGAIERESVSLTKLDGTCFMAKLVSKLSINKSFVQTAVSDITLQLNFKHELDQKLKEHTLELTDSLNRAKEVNDIKTRFVSYASHELRTPLSCILSSLSLIEMYHEPNQHENRTKHIKQIASSVNDLKTMLDDFLAIALLEKTDISKEIRCFNLPDFFKNIIDEVSGIINAKQQCIDYSHEGDVLIHSSEKILKNILLNLFSNASKYSQSGSSIHLYSSIFNNQLIFSVKDHGIGIPQTDHNQLFSDFYRATNVQGIQGTGLGLNIVKKYVELLRGKISFDSEVGEGTTFTIEIPVL